MTPSPSHFPHPPRLSFKDRIKDRAKSIVNIHRGDGRPDVFVFTMPRSGSTWLMELIGDQPGFKTCSEPLNVRLPLVREHLGASSWHHLHEPWLEEPLRQYIQAFREGRLHFLDPIPFRSTPYRFWSNRIVFKIVHGGEERIEWFRRTFAGKIVYLLRHPIAVSLSHEVLPRLNAYVESPYRENFTAEQLSFAKSVIEGGDALSQGVLAWCFENAVPLRDRREEWAVVTYEQLVLEPRPVIEHVIERLDLADPQRMLGRLNKASGVKEKSDPATRRLLDQADQESRRKLVEKWQSKVAPDTARRAMDILARFGISAYRHGSTRPDDALWIDSGR